MGLLHVACVRSDQGVCSLVCMCLNVALLFMRSCRSFDPQPDSNEQHICDLLRYFVKDDHFEYLCPLLQFHWRHSLSYFQGVASFMLRSHVLGGAMKMHLNKLHMDGQCTFNLTALATSSALIYGTLWPTLHARRPLKDSNSVALHLFVFGARLVAQEKKD